MNGKENEQKGRKFSVNVASLIGGQFLIALISLVNSIVVARALGVEDRGYFLMAAMLPNILITFSDFGLGQANTKFVASKKWLASTVFVSNTIVICIRLFVIGIVGCVFVHFYSEIFFPGIPKTYLYLGLLQSIALVIQGTIFPIFLGLGYGVRYSLILVASSALSLVTLSVGWLTFGLSVNLALVLQFCSSLAVAIYIYFSVLKHIGELGKMSKQYLIEAFHFGSGIYLSIVSTFANQKMVLIVLNFYGGVVFVSLYTIAQALAERMYLISDAVGTILMPKVAEDPKVNSGMYTPLVFKLTVLVVTFFSILLMFVSEWLVTFVYGSDFTASGEIIRVLLLAGIFLSGWRVLSQDLIAKGMTKKTAFVNIVMAVTSLGTSILLLPTMGLLGAAWGAVVGAVLSIALGWWFYMQKDIDYYGVTNSLFTFSKQEIQTIKIAFVMISPFKKY
jgi:O-antigen/teichoic acid export membrane protein